MFKIGQGTVISVGTILLLIYLANFIFAIIYFRESGTFGDSFGTVNALFSGCALFFLVLAFLSQREELNLIKEERDDTRQLLVGQEKINQTQQSALDRQVFESSFFSLISTISNEFGQLDQRYSDKSTNSKLQRAFHVTKESAGKIENFTGSKEELHKLLDSRISICIPFCRLISLANQLIENSPDGAPTSYYMEILRAMFEPQSAFLFGYLAYVLDDNSTLIQTFENLQLDKNISPNERFLLNDLAAARVNWESSWS